MIEFDRVMIWRRRASAPGEPPVYNDSTVSGRIVGRVRRRPSGEYGDTCDKIEALFAPPAEPAPGDLIRLEEEEFRVAESRPCPDLGGTLRGCRCTLLR